MCFLVVLLSQQVFYTLPDSAQISWLLYLWWSRDTLPTGKMQSSLMDELCNIITHNKVEGCLFFLFTFL